MFLPQSRGKATSKTSNSKNTAEQREHEHRSVSAKSLKDKYLTSATVQHFHKPAHCHRMMTGSKAPHFQKILLELLSTILEFIYLVLSLGNYFGVLAQRRCSDQSESQVHVSSSTEIYVHVVQVRDTITRSYAPQDRR